MSAETKTGILITLILVALVIGICGLGYEASKHDREIHSHWAHCQLLCMPHLAEFDGKTDGYCTCDLTKEIR